MSEKMGETPLCEPASASPLPPAPVLPPLLQDSYAILVQGSLKEQICLIFYMI